MSSRDENNNIGDSNSATDFEQDRSFLCCPSEFINWDEPHGLLYYNLPWFPKRTSAIDWFIDKRDRIRIPDKHSILPSYLFFIPCVWFYCPCMEANSILLYIDNQQLKIQTHQKGLCSETIRQSNNSDSIVERANVEEQTKKHREIRLNIVISNFESSIQTQWLPYNFFTARKMILLKDIINSYVYKNKI